MWSFGMVLLADVNVIYWYFEVAYGSMEGESSES